MILVVSLFAAFVLIMATQYDEDSRRILEHWGFLCGKKQRTVRNPRIEVFVIGDVLKEVGCILKWKDIQIDDQIVKLNGLSVAKLENNQIRTIMLLSCPTASLNDFPNLSSDADTSTFSVEFTNAHLQYGEEVNINRKEKIKQKYTKRSTTSEKEMLSPKEKKSQRNKSRPSTRTIDKYEGLSPKEKRAQQNKERVHHSVNARKGGKLRVVIIFS
jgi:hypothetical protein